MEHNYFLSSSMLISDFEEVTWEQEEEKGFKSLSSTFTSPTLCLRSYNDRERPAGGKL